MSVNIIFRYDPDATGTINGEKLLNKLGIAFHNGSAGEDQIDRLSPVPESGQLTPLGFLKIRHIDKLMSLWYLIIAYAYSHSSNTHV